MNAHPYTQDDSDEEERRLIQASPRQAALWLAIMASDIPGFDNSDRANLRRIAQALSGAVPLEYIPRMVETTIRQRRGVAFGGGARPEAAVLAAVLKLVLIANRDEAAADVGASGHAE